ncbi:hypothetical protein [Streptomyces griseorubiginosus]|uniref:hypothetical protein n=1 Tax=Streptomyces griseorubiginosus TaxID=67304 RepID=UPI0036F0C597
MIVSEVAALFAGDEEEFAALAGAGPELAARARDVACGFLRVLAPDGGPEAEAVLLVVSELVTNAVWHAGGFGWPMVQELALNVQVSIGPSGKTVSAVLPLPY